MAQWSRLIAAGVLVGTVSVVAGCGGQESPELPSPAPSEPATPPASPTVSLSPRDAEAAEEILAAFDAYMAAYIELSREGAPGGSQETLARLEDVPVVGPAAFQLTDDVLARNHQAGAVTQGSITWSAEVVEIDWDFTSPRDPERALPVATLRVCFDETNWTTVEADTGQVISGPGERHLSTVTAHWLEAGTDGVIGTSGWYINDRQDSSEPC